MGGGTAVFLLDSHGGETADVLILSLDDPQDAVLAGDGGKAGMEIARQGRKPLDIVLADERVHGGELFPQGSDILGGRVFNNVGQRQHLQGVADGIDLIHILGGEGMHHDTAAHDILDQAVPLQLAERFPQRGTGNMKPVGIFCFDDSLTGGDFPGDNGLFQHIVGNFTDRTTLRHGLKRQRHRQFLLRLCGQFVYKINTTKKQSCQEKLQTHPDKQPAGGTRRAGRTVIFLCLSRNRERAVRDIRPRQPAGPFPSR